MSDSTNPPAGGANGSGGTGGNNPEPKPDSVTRSAYEDAVTEAKKARERAQAAEARLAELDAEKKRREDDEAKKRGEYEKLLADREAELAKERAERAALETERTNMRKLGALHKALGAPIDQKFLPLVDLERIKVNQDGTISQESLTKYADDFKSTYPMILGKPAGVTPPDATPQGGNTGEVTDEQFAKMSLKEKRQHMATYAKRVATGK